MNKNEQYRYIYNTLDPQQLMDDAKALTGFSDFGNEEFVPAFRNLVERAAREVDFQPNNALAYRDGYLLRFLANRLRAENDFKLHPEILEEDVSDPIIIIGLPRSGTTKLQRLITTSPTLQKPVAWKLLNPAPIGAAVEGEPDPRIAAAKAAYGDWSEEVMAAHTLGEDEAEEEIMLFDYTFDYSVAGFTNYLPLFSYDEWSEDYSSSVPYRYIVKLLQYLQWQDGGKRNRPWLLKAIMHIAHMDQLMECFPNATLVHSHRDPRNCIPSFAKLMSGVWEMQSNPVDKIFAGHGFLHWGSAAINRYLEARKRLNLDGRILDIKYEQIRDEPISVMKHIYDKSGLEWTNTVEQLIRQWEQDHPQHSHGKHAYSLEEFGLSETAIDQAFGSYINRFIDR